ncbi:MAG TPA: sucrase ferredoxin [Roseiflexaceae bacterium]|nr:sucrase ferredoxin [Roseiflexaceae bacterium]
MTITDTERFCSACARQAGLDPAGSAASTYTTVLALELPLPWPYALWGDSGRVPPEAQALTDHIREEYQRTGTVQLGLIAVAPDPDDRPADRRRLICWQRPDGPFAQFRRSEYRLSAELLGPLAYALALAPERLPSFEGYRQEQQDIRDLLVCTHGSVDAACGKFGYPAYRHLRGLAAGTDGRVRVWRTSHFGGHVFAPTLIDMPHGSYWAYIGPEQAAQLLDRSGPASDLRDHYRGWSGAPGPFGQVLERELFLRHGWPWLDYAKDGCITAQEQPDAPEREPRWAEVRMEYRAPDGTTGVATARIEQADPVEVIHTSGKPDTYPFPQYSVAWLRDEPS